MKRKKGYIQKQKDRLLNGIMYGSSMVSVILLCAIGCFIFMHGFQTLDWNLLKNNYWANTYLTVMDNVQPTKQFQRPDDLDDEVIFSKKWGIGIVESKNTNDEKVLTIAYLDSQSPFQSMIDKSVVNGKVIHIQEGYEIDRIKYLDKQGKLKFIGNVIDSDKYQFIESLDHDVVNIQECFFKSSGGGIRGSIITTLYLIVVSLLVALPLGISAAIYLHEYAKQSRLTKAMRSAIEMLSGVPSIIYGLMGVSVLFPITQLFHATTTNILLGALTLSIILLPTIIRASEEALRNVPQSLREASLSLGASQTQTIFKVVLPNALAAILTGIILSVGRIVGESAALIYTMGTYVNDSPTLLSQGTSLAVHIYNIMSSEQPNFELACAISLVILLFVLMLNIFVKIISKRFIKQYA